jgi:hypothetical protein
VLFLSVLWIIFTFDGFFVFFTFFSVIQFSNSSSYSTILFCVSYQRLQSYLLSAHLPMPQLFVISTQLQLRIRDFCSPLAFSQLATLSEPNSWRLAIVLGEILLFLNCMGVFFELQLFQCVCIECFPLIMKFLAILVFPPISSSSSLFLQFYHTQCLLHFVLDFLRHQQLQPKVTIRFITTRMNHGLFWISFIDFKCHTIRPFWTNHRLITRYCFATLSHFLMIFYVVLSPPLFKWLFICQMINMWLVLGINFHFSTSHFDR